MHNLSKYSVWIRSNHRVFPYLLLLQDMHDTQDFQGYSKSSEKNRVESPKISWKNLRY